MARPRRHSRSHVVILLMVLLAVGLVLVDGHGLFASRIRTIAAHVFAPGQGWLKGTTLTLLGRAPADGVPTDLESASTQRLKDMVTAAMQQKVQQDARIADL
jgi:hypothetical protein